MIVLVVAAAGTLAAIGTAQAALRGSTTPVLPHGAPQPGSSAVALAGQGNTTTFVEKGPASGPATVVRTPDRGTPRPGRTTTPTTTTLTPGAGTEPDKGGPVPIGVLRGRLYGEGGAPPGVRVPWAGAVTVTGKDFHREIVVGADGAYSVSLPAGTYRVVGHSPSHLGNASCSGGQPVHIRDFETVTIDVSCPIP
jgi:hypothetical protein